MFHTESGLLQQVGIVRRIVRLSRKGCFLKLIQANTVLTKGRKINRPV